MRDEPARPLPPCRCAEHPTGRVEVEDGWCVEGVYYSRLDIKAINRMRTLHGPEKMDTVIPALRKLHAVFGFDFMAMSVSKLDDVR